MQRQMDAVQRRYNAPTTIRRHLNRPMPAQRCESGSPSSNHLGDWGLRCRKHGNKHEAGAGILPGGTALQVGVGAELGKVQVVAAVGEHPRDPAAMMRPGRVRVQMDGHAGQWFRVESFPDHWCNTEKRRRPDHNLTGKQSSAINKTRVPCFSPWFQLSKGTNGDVVLVERDLS